MAQTTAQSQDRISFNPFTNNLADSQPQTDERVTRYSGVFGKQQQPEQTSASSQQIKAESRAAYNLNEVSQGIKELQERINSTLKRSSSATPIRAHPNLTAVTKAPALKVVPHDEVPSATTVKTMDSFYEGRSNISPIPFETSKLNDISTSTIRERFESINMQSPQMSSSKFYLGGLNSVLPRKEELLNTIQNYQVKTIHTLNSQQLHSTRSLYTNYGGYQEAPPKRASRPLGSSAIISNTNFVPIDGFKPGYDVEKLDEVISKIMSTNQSYSGLKQDSFVTHHDSYCLSSKVLEQESYIRTPQQQSRPVKQAPPTTTANKTSKTGQKRPNVVEQYKQTKQTKPQKSSKESWCGEVEADGDSMICEFIRQKDELHDFNFDDEEVTPAKRVREEEEEDKPQPKKLSKRQEILNSKKLAKKDTNVNPTQKSTREAQPKSQTSEKNTKKRN